MTTYLWLPIFVSFGAVCTIWPINLLMAAVSLWRSLLYGLSCCWQGLTQDSETGCPKLVIVKYLGILFFRWCHNMLRLPPQTCIYLLKLEVIYLYNAIGIVLKREKSITCLKLTFLEIPYKKIWAYWRILFGGFGCPNDTQMPCWLRLCCPVLWG